MSETIIYTHYGVSDYLSRTLGCASITNPSARRILIGDDDNRKAAREAGWDFVAADDLQSDQRRQFSEVFRWVQGKEHEPLKSGRDWLGYCFERYLILQAYCAESRIPHFWFFDSDVMITTELSPFGETLRRRGIPYTRQCNDICLKGYIEAPILSGFCPFMVALFKDEKLLAERQRDYDERHQGWAFTDMSAFEIYSREKNPDGVHLEAYFEPWWFDDAICQDDDFDMVRIRAVDSNLVKDIRFINGGFYGRRAGKEYRFAAINCSWVPVGVFDWILARVQATQRGKKRPDDAISMPWLGPPHLLSRAMVLRIRSYFETRMRQRQ
jgi:hypothetical protein